MGPRGPSGPPGKPGDDVSMTAAFIKVIYFYLIGRLVVAQRLENESL